MGRNYIITKFKYFLTFSDTDNVLAETNQISHLHIFVLLYKDIQGKENVNVHYFE